MVGDCVACVEVAEEEREATASVSEEVHHKKRAHKQHAEEE